MNKNKNIVVMMVIVVVFYCAPAEAYIDPGAGSYFLQVALGAGLAALYGARNYLKRLRAWLFAKRDQK